MFSRNAWLFYILALSLTTFYLSRFPGHNGDMPFYIALVIEKEQGSMDGVVERTKEVLRQELPSKEYQDHADRINSVDQMIFERYRIKPFYVLLVLTFHKLGFSYIHATLIPSLLCYFLIGLSIWQVVIKRLDPVKTFLVSMVCMLIFPTLLLARLSTPDSLSCFILLNAVFLIYFGRSKILWYSLFMLAICTRLDNVVSELIFLFALWKWPVDRFANKLDTKKYILMSLGLIGIALLVNLTATHHFLWFMDPDFFGTPRTIFKKYRVILLCYSRVFFYVPVRNLYYFRAQQGIQLEKGSELYFFTQFVRLFSYGLFFTLFMKNDILHLICYFPC